MARKATRKKPAKKGARPAAARAKTTKKRARKSTTAKSQASKVSPSKVTTGRGPTPEVIGKDLVQMVNRGVADTEIWDKHFDRNFVSIEGHGKSWAGRAAVQAKNDAWASEWDIESMIAEGPYVGATGFSVKYVAELRYRPTGRKHTQHEVGVYTVRNGKVIIEEFFYGP